MEVQSLDQLKKAAPMSSLGEEKTEIESLDQLMEGPRSRPFQSHEENTGIQRAAGIDAAAAEEKRREQRAAGIDAATAEEKR
ncbi:GL21197 [Drosophila persimilis]|uniref:GL21197 n=1 Tax=Drosophila persimilis TaxID=7234 RepID=B4GWU7_DROPE|nr:GL21197 [Drosophila persimilis]